MTILVVVKVADFNLEPIIKEPTHIHTHICHSQVHPQVPGQLPRDSKTWGFSHRMIILTPQLRIDANRLQLRCIMDRPDHRQSNPPFVARKTTVSLRIIIILSDEETRLTGIGSGYVEPDNLLH